MCNICDNKFTANSSLKRHSSEQHKISEFGESIYPEEAKVYICNVCDVIFTEKTISSHMPWSTLTEINSLASNVGNSLPQSP